MFCHKCGTQIADGAAFCHKCGAKVVVDTPVGQSTEFPRTNPVQQPATVPMDTPRKKKSKFPIIPGIMVLAIILIILVVIGSKSGSSTPDGFSSDGIDIDISKISNGNDISGNDTTNEVLYNGIPVSQLLGLTPDEVIDLLGNPSYKNDASLDYTGIEFVLYGDNNTVGEIHGDPQFFTMNDQTLDKGYEEIIQMLGEADYESDSKYSVGLLYNTNNYQMYIFVEWEEDRANQIEFLLPTDDDEYDDYGGIGWEDDYDDYYNTLDLSLVGRWRAYDGSYVEFTDYGAAAVSSSLTPYGSLGKPDYVTWEAYNGRIILLPHYSQTRTYEMQTKDSIQGLILSNSLTSRYFYRTEIDSSIVGTWKENANSEDLILLSDGTGAMRMLPSLSSTSLDMVPITWQIDDKYIYIDWAVQTAYDYTVSGDILTIFFSNGSNIYQRVGN